MDFITRLSKVHGMDCIYVVVDRLTKYTCLFSIPTEYSTYNVADIFFGEVFSIHGLLRNIISDQNSRFHGAFWRELFRLFRTGLTPRTSYHPKTYRNTEIVNKWVEGYLRNYVL